jgi:hypothetical protein
MPEEAGEAEAARYNQPVTSTWAPVVSIIDFPMHRQAAKAGLKYHPGGKAALGFPGHGKSLASG